jgi:hypothetical protein
VGGDGTASDVALRCECGAAHRQHLLRPPRHLAGAPGAPIHRPISTVPLTVEPSGNSKGSDWGHQLGVKGNCCALPSAHGA